MPPLADSRKEAFARLVAAGKKKSAAALAIGYPEQSCSAMGFRLGQHPHVAARIRELQDEIAREVVLKSAITVDRVLEEYRRIAYFDPRKAFDKDGRFLPVHKMDADVAATIGGFQVGDVVIKDEKKKTKSGDTKKDKAAAEEKTRLESRVNKVKFIDKKGALDSIAKHLGMFTERRAGAADRLDELVAAMMGPIERRPADNETTQ